MVAARVGKKEVRELLSKLLVELAGVSSEGIHDGSTIDSDLRMESVAFLELQVALEDELGIEIDPVRVVELNELGQIADYIHTLAIGQT